MGERTHPQPTRRTGSESCRKKQTCVWASFLLRCNNEGKSKLPCTTTKMPVLSFQPLRYTFPKLPAVQANGCVSRLSLQQKCCRALFHEVRHSPTAIIIKSRCKHHLRMTTKIHQQLKLTRKYKTLQFRN